MTKESDTFTEGEFLLYSPLNQGLKHLRRLRHQLPSLCFYSTVH